MTSRKKLLIKREPIAAASNSNADDDWGTFFTMPSLEPQQHQPAAEAETSELHDPLAQGSTLERADNRAQRIAAGRAKALAGSKRLLEQAFSDEAQAVEEPETATVATEETDEYLQRKDILQDVTAPADVQEQPLTYEGKRLMAAMRNPEGALYRPPETTNGTGTGGKRGGNTGQPKAKRSRRKERKNAAETNQVIVQEEMPDASATTLTPEAGSDSDAQDAKLSHRIQKEGEKHKAKFQAKLRRKRIDPCPRDAIPEEQQDAQPLAEGVLVHPLPEGTTAEESLRPPDNQHMAPPVAEEMYAPGLREDAGIPENVALLRGMDYNARVTHASGAAASSSSSNRKGEDLDGLTAEELVGVRSDLDRPMSVRQAADGRLPTMHQLFFYPHDENRYNEDPVDKRSDRKRQGQRGDEYYSLLDEDEAARKKREQDAREELDRVEREALAQEAADAVHRDAEGRRLERTVEETCDALVMRYRNEQLDMSRICNYLQQTRHVFVHEGSDNVILRKLASAEPHDRLGDDSWLRQARPGEPQCMKGLECEGRKIGRGTVPVTNLARFSERDMRDCAPGTFPVNISRACEMCRRRSAFYFYLQNRSARQPMPANVSIADFCHLPDDKGQYALEQCIMNSSQDPVQLLPVPVLMHCRGNYRQVPDEDGYYSWAQDGYYMPTADLSVILATASDAPNASQTVQDFGRG